MVRICHKDKIDRLSSKRCSGHLSKTRYQVYWRAKKNKYASKNENLKGKRGSMIGTCDGVYFEIEPKSGHASQNKKSLYPKPGEPDFNRQMMAQIPRGIPESHLHEPQLLGRGPGRLGPKDTENTRCMNIGGRRIKTQRRRRSQRRGQRRTQRRR